MSESAEPRFPKAPDGSPEPVAVLTNVHKSYRLDQVEVPVLRGLDVLIRPGLFTVILGPSGSGKTTLLNLLGGLDRPEQGEITVSGQRLNDMSDDALADFRSEHIGFVFQNFNLIPVLSAYENIEYPLVIAGVPAAKRANRVSKLLTAVGLSDRARNKPGELSGGQRQRVAIARALVRRPKLVIADEPTANLDSRTGAAILALMRRMQTRYGISFVFSSHDRDLIHAADDLITLTDGVIRSVRRWQMPASLPIPRSTQPVDEDPLGLDTLPMDLDTRPGGLDSGPGALDEAEPAPAAATPLPGPVPGPLPALALPELALGVMPVLPGVEVLESMPAELPGGIADAPLHQHPQDARQPAGFGAFALSGGPARPGEGPARGGGGWLPLLGEDDPAGPPAHGLPHGLPPLPGLAPRSPLPGP